MSTVSWSLTKVVASCMRCSSSSATRLWTANVSVTKRVFRRAACSRSRFVGVTMATIEIRCTKAASECPIQRCQRCTVVRLTTVTLHRPPSCAYAQTTHVSDMYPPCVHPQQKPVSKEVNSTQP